MTELTKTEVRQMIKDQINSSVEKMIEAKVKEILSDKATEKQIKEVIVATMIKFYKLMYLRSSAWIKQV